MYSDMSNRTSSTPSVNASWRVTSVLPTPVGPENRNEPTGRRSSPSPERAILMAEASAPIARSWPKITSFRSRSMLRSTSRSEAETFFGGMRAIFATMFWMSSTSTMRGRLLSG